MLRIECYPLGELAANCYFVFDEEAGVSFIVDMGAPSEKVIGRINEFGGDRLKYILLTHGHFDHIGNTAELKKMYPDAQIVIGEKDSDFTDKDSLNLSVFFGLKNESFKADITVNDGDKLPFGNSFIEILSTPGHTAGGVCYKLGNYLFTGDTIMKCTTGRMDFPTGNMEDMLRSAKKIAGLDGNLILLCGHGEKTTLEYERMNNIAMRSHGYDDLY